MKEDVLKLSIYNKGGNTPIILLSGRPNTGKTSTINLVYEEFIKQGASVVKEKKQLGNNEMDFESVLQYQNKLIAIYSMGDYYRCCRSALKKYAKCDFLILAYSDKFKWNLKNAIAKNPRNYIINKTIDNTNEAQKTLANLKDASAIISIIK